MRGQPLVVGLIWGALLVVLIASFNENYEALMARATVDGRYGLLFFGLLAFAGLTAVILLINLLFGLFSSRRRGAAWSWILGAILGFAFGDGFHSALGLPGIEAFL